MDAMDVEVPVPAPSSISPASRAPTPTPSLQKISPKNSRYDIEGDFKIPEPVPVTVEPPPSMFQTSDLAKMKASFMTQIALQERLYEVLRKLIKTFSHQKTFNENYSQYSLNDFLTELNREDLARFIARNKLRIAARLRECRLPENWRLIMELEGKHEDEIANALKADASRRGSSRMAEKAEGGSKPWVTVPVILVEKRSGVPNYEYKHGKAFMSNVDGEWWATKGMVHVENTEVEKTGKKDKKKKFSDQWLLPPHEIVIKADLPSDLLLDCVARCQQEVFSMQLSAMYKAIKDLEMHPSFDLPYGKSCKQAEPAKDPVPPPPDLEGLGNSSISSIMTGITTSETPQPE